MATNAKQGKQIEAFTFGEPIPVLERREIFDYLECVLIDNYYEPPISFEGLSRLFAPRRITAVRFMLNVIFSPVPLSRIRY